MVKYFTIAEANAILPKVTERFEKALKAHNDVIKVERKLQHTMASINANDMHTSSIENKSNNINNPLGTYIELKQELNARVTILYHSIELFRVNRSVT